MRTVVSNPIEDRLAASQPDREALKEFIVSASFASRAALDSDTIFCEIYTPGYSPAKKGSFGFFVKELRAILSLLSGAGTKSDGGGQTIKRHHYSPSTLHMGDCSICGNVYDAPLHIGSPADHAASHSAGRKPGPSDAKLAIAVSALEFVRDGYGDQDVNHVDYRVRVYEVALDALAQLTKTPSADHDAGNLRSLAEPNHHQPHALSQVAVELGKLLSASRTVHEWLSNWDLPFQDDDEWGPDLVAFCNAMNDATFEYVRAMKAVAETDRTAPENAGHLGGVPSAPDHTTMEERG